MLPVCNWNSVFRGNKLWQERNKKKLLHESPTQLRIMAILSPGRDGKTPGQTYLSATAQGQDKLME